MMGEFVAIFFSSSNTINSILIDFIINSRQSFTTTAAVRASCCSNGEQPKKRDSARRPYTSTHRSSSAGWIPKTGGYPYIRGYPGPAGTRDPAITLVDACDSLKSVCFACFLEIVWSYNEET